MNKNTFIPALPHAKISIPEAISKTKNSQKSQKSAKISKFWNIKKMVNENNISEECQSRLDQNSQNMRKMIICVLIIVFVLLANIALLYANYEAEKSTAGNILCAGCNTKPAVDMLKPIIIPKQTGFPGLNQQKYKYDVNLINP